MEIPEGLQDTVINYLEGTLTQAQADEFISWLEKDKCNIQYFKDVEKIWLASRPIKTAEPDLKYGINRIRNKITERDIRRLPAKEVRISILSLFKIAASILIIITLSISGLFFFLTKKGTPALASAMVEANAPRGSRSLIILPDSTTIWLNSDTKLRYKTDYGFTNRTVYLEGEAYFKVHKNADLPFRVFTSEIKVTALGTAFNVKAYIEEGSIETTLEEGRVAIDRTNSDKKENSDHVIVLKPKQTAIYSKQEGNFAVREPAIQNNINKSVMQDSPDILPVKISEVSDIRLFTSWKDPKWVFRNEKFSSLAIKLERRYNIKIVFVDKSIEEFTFTGTIREESIEQVLAAIRMISPIRYEIISTEVKLYKDKLLEVQYKKLTEK